MSEAGQIAKAIRKGLSGPYSDVAPDVACAVDQRAAHIIATSIVESVPADAGPERSANALRRATASLERHVQYEGQ